MATNLIGPATPADVANLPRNAMHDMIELLIHRLDLEDADPDLEENDLEDSFVLSWYASNGNGAGCPISDAGGGAVDEEPEQVNEDGYDAVLRLPPIYGIDQTKGPINEVAAYSVHMEKMQSE